MKYRMSSLVVLMAASGLPGIGSAADDACARTACRPAKMVALRADDMAGVFVMAEAQPLVGEDGELGIIPGEVVLLKFTPTKNGAGTVEVVEDRTPAPLDTIEMDDGKKLPVYSGEVVTLPEADQAGAKLPPNSILMTYGQMPGQQAMVLTITHNLDGLLVYKAIAGFWSKEGYNFQRTSTCTVISQKFGVEHWPQPIGPMILHDFTIEAGTEMRCE